MRFIAASAFLLCIAMIVNAQQSILTGTIYDAYGSVVMKAKVTATDPKGKRFEAVTDDEGRYHLRLLYNEYGKKSPFAMMKYKIAVDATTQGFKIVTIKDFNFVPAFGGKMFLDVALDGRNEVMTDLFIKQGK